MKKAKQPTQKKSLELRNEILRQWLNAHDLINVAALCRRIDYDRGNFWHFEEGTRDLPEDAIARLENELFKYGFLNN